MTPSERQSKHPFFVLLSLFLFFQVSWSANDCNYDSLPQNLNQPGYLEYDGRFHVHSQFRANFSAPLAKITFTLQQSSVVRMYIAPHEVDLDVALYSGPDLIRSSEDYIEDMIEATLEAGQTQYYFQLTHRATVEQVTDCMTVTMELAIVPSKVQEARVHQMEDVDGACGTGESIPTSVEVFAGLSQGLPVDFNSVSQGYSFNVARQPSSMTTDSLRVIEKLPFTIPVGGGGQNLWVFKATIRTDFLVGGSIGMTVTSADVEELTRDCMISGECEPSRAIVVNSKSIRDLKGSGNYVLWFYDLLESRDSELSSCSPFSFELQMSLVEQEEDFVNCEALRFPTTLNAPGLLEGGYLNYFESIFLEIGSISTTHFTLVNESYFRVLIEDHKVDIDVSLSIKENGQYKTLQSSDRNKGQDAIQSYLYPGRYELTYRFYGSSELNFCATFDTRIAIAPAEAIPRSPCHGSETDPDLSGLSQLATAHSYNLDRITHATFYTFPYDGDFSTRVIVSKEFSLSKRSRAEIVAYADFLAGDVSLELSTIEEEGEGVTTVGVHKRNRVEIVDHLEEGDYVLRVLTGVREPTLNEEIEGRISDSFPDCLKYELEIHFAPEDETLDPLTAPFVYANPDTCPIRFFPQDLMSVEFLGIDEQMHIQEPFRYVFDHSSHYEQTALFNTPDNDVVFRMFAAPAYHDVDFVLSKNLDGEEVGRSQSLLKEKEMVVALEGGTEYLFKISIDALPGSVSFDCLFFDLELAIFPFLSGDADSCEAVDPSDLLLGVALPWDGLGGNYMFPQLGLAFADSVVFELEEAAYFSASIAYDFTWNDMYLRLYDFDKNNDAAESLLVGDTLFNRNVLGPVLLQPGLYALHIQEPSVLDQTLRRCAEYTLSVSAKVATSYEAGSVDRDILLGCNGDNLAPSWNGDGWLSSLSGNQLHLQYSVLVDTSKRVRVEKVEFTVKEESALRVYVPPHSQFDIDLRLSHGTINQLGSLVAYSALSGDQEESMVQTLGAGSYILQVNVNYPASFSTTTTCPSFPLEVAIAPISYVADNTVASQECESGSLLLIPNQRVEYPVKFSRDSESQFSATFDSFEVKENSYLDFEVGFDFLTADTQVILTGELNSGSEVSFYGTPATNHRFLTKVLSAGNYTISIHEPRASSGSIDGLKCVSLYLNYLIDVNAIPDGVVLCEENYPFPRNCFSAHEGSGSYGGNQDEETGEVWVRGNEFLLPSEGEHFSFLFKIKEPSLVKVTIWGAHEEDFQMTLYESESAVDIKTVSKVLNVDRAYPVTSLFVSLAPTESIERPFVLDIEVKDRSKSPQCAYFSFDFAISSEEDKALLFPCPLLFSGAQLPLDNTTPKNYLEVSSGDVLTFPLDGYSLSKERAMDSILYEEYFVHSITISSFDEAVSLVAEVGFNFMETDIFMVLRSEEEAHASSIPMIPANSYGDVNMGAKLESLLGKKEYQIDIYILTKQYLEIFGEDGEWCIPFEFSLSILASFGDAPSVIGVSPLSGSGFSSLSDFTVLMEFSQPIGYPPLATLDEQIISYQKDDDSSTTGPIIYLAPGNNHPPQIAPMSVSHNKDGDQLTLIFDRNQLRPGTSYSLRMVGDILRAEDEEYFLSLYPVTYMMADCKCNGHGVCDPESEYEACLCDDNFEAPNCVSCQVDFHRVGSICVADEYCTDDFCEALQPCDDTGGITTCQCGEGYAGARCESCASGYDGFPDCVPLAWIGGGRPKGCQAPLIPSTLDSIGFLGSDHGAGEERFHFQDRFYVPKPDVVGGSALHEMEFTLDQKSLFRVSAGTDVTSLSVSLFLVAENGETEELQPISSGITLGKTTVVFEELAGSSIHPLHYRANFQFFENVIVDPTTCETFDLEMEIARMTIVEGELLVNEPSLCADSDSPFENYHSSSTFSYLMMHGLHFSINDDKIFNVKNTKKETLFSPFEEFRFFLMEAKDAKVGLVEVEVGDIFLTGQIGVGIAKGTSADACGSASGDCVFGERVQGRTILETVLESGFNYTLFLYEPYPQLWNEYEGTETPFTACAPYEFQMEVNWITNSIERCDLPLPPSTLFPQDPTLVDFPHYAAEFALRSESQLFFNTTTTSLFRAGVESEHTISLRVTEPATETVHGEHVVPAGEPSSLLLELPTGEFVLEVVSLDAGVVSQDACPSFRLEVALADKTSDYVAPVDCGGDYDIPSFKVLPYSYVGDQLVLSRSVPKTSPVVFTFNFTVEQEAILSLAVLDDFLTTDLSALLIKYEKEDENELTTLKTYSYNSLTAVRELTAGSSYTLQLLAPDLYEPFICVHLAIHLEISAKGEEEVCGESQELPLTLNTIQFLRPPLRSFHFKNDNLGVPNPSKNVVYHTTLFTSPLDNPSIFRMSLEFKSIHISVQLRDMASFEVVATGTEEIGANDEGGSSARALQSLLYPGTEYAIEYTFDSTALDAPLQCPIFSLEMTLHPAPESLSDCPYGGGNLWGSSTLSGSLTRDHLYFQQKVGEKIEHVYKLSQQTSSFNLFAQVTFDFGDGQLALVLKETDNVESGWELRSVVGLNSAVLSASNLPAGTYTLSVEETTSPLSGFVGCASFSLIFQAEKAAASLSLLTTPPTTLNRLPFLGYSSQVNLQGPLVLPIGSKKVAFVTKEASNLRVVVHTHETALEALTLSLSPSVRTKTSVFSLGGWEYAILEAELESDTAYHLDYDVSSEDESIAKIDVLSVYSALSIVPSTHFSSLPTCTKEPTIPAIDIDSDLQSFTWSSSVQVPIALEEERTIVAALPFKVTVDSKIYVTAEFNFPIDEIVLELYDSDVESLNASLLALGSRYFDQSSLDEVIEPGHYLLNIVSVQPKDSVYAWQERCSKFDLFISVHESTSEFSVCSSLDTLPPNLNDEQGCEKYGGALDSDGYLHLSYPRFYIDKTPGYFETEVTLSKKSRVIVYAHSTSVAEVRAHASTERYPYDDATALYTSTKGPGHVTLKFYLEQPVKESGCPYFGVDIKILPYSILDDVMECEEWEPLGLEDGQVFPIGEGGVGRYMDADYFRWSDLKTLKTIEFDIWESSELTLTLGGDSLISWWYAFVEGPEDVEGNRDTVATSSLLAYEDTSSQANLYASLTAALVEPGQYTLNLVRFFPKNHSYIHNVTCEPQIWSILVLPSTITRPIVNDVEPSQALGVSPDGELKLTMEFSEDLYSHGSVGGNLTASSSADLIAAFSLVTVDDTGFDGGDDEWEEVEGEKSAEEEGEEGEKEGEGDGNEEEQEEENMETTKKPLLAEPLWAEGEGRYWVVTFAELAAGRKYQLKLAPNQLLSMEGEEVVLLGDHYYSTIDPWCGGRGRVHTGGFCVCDSGYGGRTCRECASGWELVGRKEEGEAVCQEVEEEGGDGKVAGLVVGLIVLVGSGALAGWVHVRKRRADPFSGAFSWDEGGGEETLLDEEGLDGDALLIDGEEEGEGGRGGVMEEEEEEEGDEAANQSFFLSSSSEDGLLG